jgi:hypothetical protein
VQAVVQPNITTMGVMHAQSYTEARTTRAQVMQASIMLVLVMKHEAGSLVLKSSPAAQHRMAAPVVSEG